MNGEEQQRPMFTNGFWFMLTVLGMCAFVYSALPYFRTPIPVPKIEVKVDKEMLQKAVEEALPEVFELGAISGAKAFYIFLKKGANADKITLEQILNGARSIRKSVQKEAKVSDGRTESKPTSKDEVPGNDVGEKHKVGDVSTP